MTARNLTEMDKYAQAMAEFQSRLKEQGFSDYESALGFKDIESTETDTIVRRQEFNSIKRQYHGGFSYYRFCQQILRSYKFERDIDRAIFELHAEGKSVRFISAWTEERTLKPIKKSGIHKIIKQIIRSFKSNSPHERTRDS